MNLNKAIIVGRLTRDPETRALPSGKSVVSFSIATNRIWNDQNGQKQERVEFHNIVAFAGLADICSRYLKKGQLILIEGRLQTNSWDDQNGVKHYKTEIVADNMQMGPRPAGYDSPAPQNNDQNQMPQQPQPQPSQNISQDDIPVIDAEETPEAPIEDPDQPKEQVDVKNIPF